MELINQNVPDAVPGDRIVVFKDGKTGLKLKDIACHMLQNCI